MRVKKWIHVHLIVISLILFGFLLNCATPKGNRVEIIKSDKGYVLKLNDEPFFIKGAVAWQRFDLIQKYGGNAVRTWSRTELLDEAAKHGLVCLVNLRVRAERDGMDYDDTEAVQKQFDKVIDFVQKHKEHPAVMMWSLGNELDWIPPGVPYNRKVWSHLNDLAKKIHEIDPYHPCLTTIGSVHEEVIYELMADAPELDLIGLNEYGNILEISKWMRDFGWQKPWVFTEWGPSGFWQVPITEWKAPVEETSSMKADLYKKRYEEAILGEKEFCLGSFVFLWNQHQERTHTWFGMFDENWVETEAVDVMHYEWTGKCPGNRSPRVDSSFINQWTAYESIWLKKDKEYAAVVYVRDPDNDELTYKWEIIKEGVEFPYGGRGEKKGAGIPNAIKDNTLSEIQFKAPSEKGPYRLFVYAYDGHNHFATTNIPFYVD